MRITANDSAEPPDDIGSGEGEWCHVEFGQAAIICDRLPGHDGPHYDSVDDIEWSEVE